MFPESGFFVVAKLYAPPVSFSYPSDFGFCALQGQAAVCGQASILFEPQGKPPSAKLLAVSRDNPLYSPVVSFAHAFLTMLRTSDQVWHTQTLAEEIIRRLPEAERAAILARDQKILDALNKLKNPLPGYKA